MLSVSLPINDANFVVQNIYVAVKLDYVMC